MLLGYALVNNIKVPNLEVVGFGYAWVAFYYQLTAYSPYTPLLYASLPIAV
ncbi:hypothetical protein H6G06_22815 [Anabaena sphaerica FACHB-251]|uniref:Uncharacterized protein n=1 Tax=Anabaena sphaerica FACHB-251 TaxID=2692883 RepID=A0A926WM17_9NOST|nr:hypothetical protein [Anabaena sphaerica]MBD2296234.1 hypothetical protein [Anabaena sphaerica FACHB-251]